jgi:hypothetical protein
MRSVLTILILLVLLGIVLLYKMGRSLPTFEGFRGGGGGGGHGSSGHGSSGHGSGGHGSSGHGHRGGYGRGVDYGSGGWGWGWYGYLPYPYFGYIIANEEPVEETDIEERPCYTDLDCPTGHCSMFGICTNGLSL